MIEATKTNEDPASLNAETVRKTWVEPELSAAQDALEVTMGSATVTAGATL